MIALADMIVVLDNSYFHISHGIHAVYNVLQISVLLIM